MHKRKKKPNIKHLQKIENARLHNEFIAHLKQFCDKVSNPKVFGLIPASTIEHLFKVRCQSFRLVIAPGQDVPVAMFKGFKFMLHQLLKNTMVSLGLEGVSDITLHEYFTAGLTLILYAGRMKEDEYPNAPQVKKALAPLTTILEEGLYDKTWHQFYGILNVMSVLGGDLSSVIYAFKVETKMGTEGFLAVGFVVNMYALPTQTIQVAIEGASRPAYHVGWAFGEPAPFYDFVKIKSEDLHLNKGFLLDVYIQLHAITRLSERMDGFDTGSLHYGVFESLKAPKVFRNKKGDLLLEYRFFGIKAGYFKADIIDGRIILRTFLFLTNNGTPEGEKLNANTGILKEDKMYLTIDKLSTFITSDIGSNQKVKKMFIDAGCESLFKIDKKLYISPDGKDIKERTIADVIVTYLGLDSSLAEDFKEPG